MGSYYTGLNHQALAASMFGSMAVHYNNLVDMHTRAAKELDAFLRHGAPSF